MFFESTLGKITVNLHCFQCAPARRVSYKHISLSLIVVRLLLLLFYGLKKLLWPPRVFMEGDWGGGQQGEINGDPWWGRLKRRRGGGTRGSSDRQCGKAPLVRVMEKKIVFCAFLSVCLLIWQWTVASLFAQVNSFCCAVARSAQIVVQPAQENTLVRQGFIWTHMIFIMRENKQNKPPELSHYAACSGALCVIALYRSYVSGLRKCRASCSTFKKTKNKKNPPFFSSGSVFRINKWEVKTRVTLSTPASGRRHQIWLISGRHPPTFTFSAPPRWREPHCVLCVSLVELWSRRKLHQLCFSGTAVCAGKHSWGNVCQHMLRSPQTV